MTIYRLILQSASNLWSWVQRLFRKGGGGGPTQLQMDRRFRILAAFFCVWALTILVQTATLTLLGYRIGVGSHGKLAYLAFLVGISWQFIFQGPTGVEILECLRSQSENQQPPKVDHLYLKFNLNRTVRLIIVLVVFTCVVCSTGIISGNAAWGSAGVAVFICATAWLRIRMIRARVSTGQFGSTQYEARQLLMFLSTLFQHSRNSFDPPRPLTYRYDGELPSPVPFNAEVVL